MSSAAAPATLPPATAPLPETRQKAERVVLWLMEGLLLILLFGSPWSYGSVHPGFEFLLDTGIALLLLLWAARILIRGWFTWQKCPVALCLAALFVTAAWQLIPWPKNYLDWLSPRTAQLYQFLLPAEPEILVRPEGEATASAAAGSTISFCPGVTQREALRFLTIFLVFALVRNNLASSGQLRRLSIVVFANGILLSLFALMQFFSYGSHLMYGVSPSEGSAFGPFICRNHFPYYVNICLGLGIGLLLSSLVGRAKSRRSSSSRSSSSQEGGEQVSSRSRSSSSGERIHYRYSLSGEGSSVSDFLSLVRRFLNRPRLLVLCLAVTILAAGILFSASRGGGLAMIGGAFLCLLFHLRRTAAAFKLGLAAVVFGVVVTLLLVWLGMEQMQERWEQLFETDVTQVERVSLWSANLPSFREFPLWGTGYGSFEYTELLHRDNAELQGTLWEHAHNDYLEVLLEGGLAGLLPVLIMVGLLFWFGYRAIRRQKESSAGWLATGAFFGVGTLAIHSFVDFGLHIPAVAFLATVLCAHLCALGSRRHRSAESSDTISVRWAGIAPAAAALILGVFAVVLIQQSWKAHKAERFRVAADQLVNNVENPNRPLQIAYLQAAVRETPRMPYLRLDLARAQMGLYLETVRTEREQALLQAVAHGAACALEKSMSPWGISLAADEVIALIMQERILRRAAAARTEPLLLPALASYLTARDLCPLMTEPNLRLAANTDKLKRGDAAEVYLSRAKFLSPADADVWYLSGRHELLVGRREQAWQDWRRSLELSEIHLADIMDQARPLLRTEDLLSKVLPEKPKVVYDAALYLRPADDETADRRPYFRRALALLASRDTVEPEEQFIQALIFDELGQRKEALAACEKAVQHIPRLLRMRPSLGRVRFDEDMETQWRLEYVRLLYDDGQLREAEREARTILNQHPSHSQARLLLAEIRKEIARQD